jgi:hypothetical protein
MIAAKVQPGDAAGVVGKDAMPLAAVVISIRNLTSAQFRWNCLCQRSAAISSGR